MSLPDKHLFLRVKQRLDYYKLPSSFPNQALPLIAKIVAKLDQTRDQSQNQINTAQLPLQIQDAYKQQIVLLTHHNNQMHIEIMNLKQRNLQLNSKINFIMTEQIKNNTSVDQKLWKIKNQRQKQLLEQINQIKFKYNELMNFLHEDQFKEKMYIKRLLKHKNIPIQAETKNTNLFFVKQTEKNINFQPPNENLDNAYGIELKIKKLNQQIYNRDLQILRLQKQLENDCGDEKRIWQKYTINKIQKNNLICTEQLQNQINLNKKLVAQINKLKLATHGKEVLADQILLLKREIESYKQQVKKSNRFNNEIEFDFKMLQKELAREEQKHLEDSQEKINSNSGISNADSLDSKTKKPSNLKFVKSLDNKQRQQSKVKNDFLKKGEKRNKKQTKDFDRRSEERANKEGLVQNLKNQIANYKNILVKKNLQIIQLKKQQKTLNELNRNMLEQKLIKQEKNAKKMNYKSPPKPINHQEIIDLRQQNMKHKRRIEQLEQELYQKQDLKGININKMNASNHVNKNNTQKNNLITINNQNKYFNITTHEQTGSQTTRDNLSSKRQNTGIHQNKSIEKQLTTEHQERLKEKTQKEYYWSLLEKKSQELEAKEKQNSQIMKQNQKLKQIKANLQKQLKISNQSEKGKPEQSSSVQHNQYIEIKEKNSQLIKKIQLLESKLSQSSKQCMQYLNVINSLRKNMNNTQSVQSKIQKINQQMQHNQKINILEAEIKELYENNSNLEGINHNLFSNLNQSANDINVLEKQMVLLKTQNTSLLQKLKLLELKLSIQSKQMTQYQKRFQI